jgi:hypothetical protein
VRVQNRSTFVELQRGNTYSSFVTLFPDASKRISGVIMKHLQTVFGNHQKSSYNGLNKVQSECFVFSKNSDTQKTLGESDSRQTTFGEIPTCFS